MTAEETVVYDILRDGIGWTPILLIAMWLFGAAAVVRVLYQQRKQGKGIVFLIFWLFMWLTMGGIGFGNVVYQHVRCRSWAQSGTFETVEGPVTAFRPGGAKKGGESFTVGGVTFTYSSANLGRGGYRRESGERKGPIRDGVVVRVRYREGRILRLAILNDNRTPTQIERP